MRWKAIAMMWLTLFVVATASPGCAHRQYVKAGDEAMEQNNPRQAVEHYRQAHRVNPRSEAIQNKLDRAEEEVLQDALAQMAEGMAGDDPDEAMIEALEATRLIEETDRLDMLERRAERIVLEQSAARQGEGDYQGALRLIDIHVQAFGQPLEPVATRERAVRAEWYEVLREEGDKYLRDGHAGAAALYFRKAAEVAGLEDGGERASRAYRRVMSQDSWGVLVEWDAEPRRVQRVLGRTYEEDLPSSLRNAREGNDYGREARLRIFVEEATFDEWDEPIIRSDEYQSGTEWVPNPEYERAYQRALDAEERMLRAEREVTSARRDLREAERALREKQRSGRSTSIEESRVDRAHRNLDRRERQLDERRHDLERRNIEMRRIDRQIEQPVYTELRYEVILQHGALSTTVQTDVVIDDDDFSAHVEFEAEFREVSEYYDAQPELNLPSRYDAPPAPEDLETPLDEEIGEGIGVFLARAFEMYREELVEAAEDGHEADLIDAMARVILLDPSRRKSEVEDRLSEMTGFEDAAPLLIRLAREVK